MTLSATTTPLPTKYTDANGAPLANGKVWTYAAGSSTPKTTYQDAGRGATNANPVVLDADGHADIFLSTGAYDLTVYDENDVLVPTACLEGIVDLAETQLPILGNTFAAGARGVASGYTVLATDYLVTVDGTGGANPCVILLPAATSGHQLTIQNIGDVPVAITPHGADTINALVASAVWTMPAAVSAVQIFPTATLYPDGTSNWRGLQAFPPANLVTSPTGGGIKIAVLSGSLDGSNPTPVVTGLTTVLAACPSIFSTSTPSTTGTVTLTCGVSGGTVNIYAFKSDGSPSTGTEGFTLLAAGV